MFHYTYQTSGVCSVAIDLDIDGDTIHNVQFTGGCNGNLKAISKLVEGMSVDRLESLLLGNTCGGKGTSCADQLARAVRKAYQAQQIAK